MSSRYEEKTKPYKLALAEYVLSFSSLEHSLDRLIWRYLGFEADQRSQRRGMILTNKLSIRVKQKVLSALLKESDDEENLKIERAEDMKELNKIIDERNDLIHSEHLIMVTFWERDDLDWDKNLSDIDNVPKNESVRATILDRKLLAKQEDLKSLSIDDLRNAQLRIDALRLNLYRWVKKE